MVFQLVEVNINVGFEGGCEAFQGEVDKEVEEGVWCGPGFIVFFKVDRIARMGAAGAGRTDAALTAIVAMKVPPVLMFGLPFGLELTVAVHVRSFCCCSK